MPRTDPGKTQGQDTGRREEARWPAGFWAAPWGAARPLGPFPRGGRPGRPCPCLQLCPVPRTHRNCMATTPHRPSLHLSLLWLPVGAGLGPACGGAGGAEGPGLRGRGMGGRGNQPPGHHLPRVSPSLLPPCPVPSPSLRLELISQRPLPQTGRPSGPPPLQATGNLNQEAAPAGTRGGGGAEGAPDFPGGRIESRLGRHLSPPKTPSPRGCLHAPRAPPPRRSGRGTRGQGVRNRVALPKCAHCVLSLLPPPSLPLPLHVPGPCVCLSPRPHDLPKPGAARAGQHQPGAGGHY